MLRACSKLKLTNTDTLLLDRGVLKKNAMNVCNEEKVQIY